MIHLGKGPCQRGHENDDIPLTGETRQAEDGGTWWKVEEGECCRICGQRFGWMYEAPIVLELGVRVRECVEANP
jgi:hypothetical protein